MATRRPKAAGSTRVLVRLTEVDSALRVTVALREARLHRLPSYEAAALYLAAVAPADPAPIWTTAAKADLVRRGKLP